MAEAIPSLTLPSFARLGREQEGRAGYGRRTLRPARGAPLGMAALSLWGCRG